MCTDRRANRMETNLRGLHRVVNASRSKGQNRISSLFDRVHKYYIPCISYQIKISMEGLLAFIGELWEG
jgi:hypothetical protein